VIKLRKILSQIIDTFRFRKKGKTMKTSSTLSRHLLESLWLPLLAVIVATCACNLFQAGPAASATEKPASAGEPTSQNPSSGGVQPTFPANQTTPDPYADRVVSFTPGNPASQCCNNPDSSLGPPDFNEATMSGWITLGIGGSITLEFTDNMAVNGNGSDIEIFGDPANDEQWTVEVSADGVNYKSFGMVSERASLDLAKVGLDSARFVRITDDGSPSKGGVSPGAEVDAIQVLNSST
jgi:hypothetical protein